MTASTPAKIAAEIKNDADREAATNFTPADADQLNSLQESAMHESKSSAALDIRKPAYTDPFGRIWDDVNCDGRGVNEHVIYEAVTLRPREDQWVEVAAWRRYYSDGEVRAEVNIEANSASLSAEQVDQLIASLVCARNSIQVRED